MNVKMNLPLLPLRDIVVFPSMVIPLFVGRDKSINALNEVSKSSLPIAQETRALGINFLHSSPQIRKGLMKLGLGLS